MNKFHISFRADILFTQLAVVGSIEMNSAAPVGGRGAGVSVR